MDEIRDQLTLNELFSHTPQMSHYVYVVAFFCIVIGLLWGRFKAMHVFGFTVLALLVSGFMGIKHLYSAAVNPSLLTVMALIALTSVLKRQIRLERAFKLLGKKPPTFLFGITGFTAVLSALVNNTPIVALLIPAIKTHAHKQGWSARLFLLPLSFAAVAGGTITLIGTSTNLVLNGMMLENGIEGFGFFDFALPGLAVSAGVLIVSILLAPIVLKKEPATSTSIENVEERAYTTELKVIPNGSMDGKTVKEAKLRNLPELYLAELYRDGKFISPVGPKEVLQANDTLFFTGALDSVNVEEKFKVEGRSNLLEVIVPNNSDLINLPLKETNFRSRYDAVIIGVQRGGQPLSGKIGRMVLQAGDLLLLATGSAFAERNQKNTPLIPITEYDRVAENKLGRERYFLPSLFAIAIAGYALSWTLLLTLALMLVSAIACGLTHADKLKQEFNTQLFALLVLSVAFGSAVVEGGHASYFIQQLALPENPTLAIASLFVGTLLLTNFMTNVSAVAIAFPVGAALMQQYGLGHLQVFLPVAFGASASFLTPTSYQTHLMVMGAGQYTQKDFMRLGLPVLIVYSAVALWVLL
jgi:di/tricarboxylate transporter